MDEEIRARKISYYFRVEYYWYVHVKSQGNRNVLFFNYKVVHCQSLIIKPSNKPPLIWSVVVLVGSKLLFEFITKVLSASLFKQEKLMTENTR